MTFPCLSAPRLAKNPVLVFSTGGKTLRSSKGEQQIWSKSPFSAVLNQLNVLYTQLTGGAAIAAPLTSACTVTLILSLPMAGQQEELLYSLKGANTVPYRYVAPILT